MTEPTSKERAGRARLIELIDRPLGFYVLSLLIVESFIGATVALSNQAPDNVKLGMWLGVGMFFYITITVTIIVWNKAHVLTFDRDAHLRDRKQAPYGTSKKTVKDPSQLPPPEEKPDH